MKLCPTCGTQWPDEQKFCPNDGSALRSAAGAADLVGSVIAERYHIIKKLGEGGMGAVYLGEHVKMGRKSAIKVMTQSMAHDPDAIARFNREAANAARITHPNVCAIYDFGETDDGLIYLAMEFIEGGSLTDVIETEGALPSARAGRILHQAGEALQAAHDLGIVHRDLKPDNIMLARRRDGADVVKVVDFGIAKAMGGEEGQKVTKTGLVVGTPEYMSPEQLAGDKLDGRSDTYSLALVFYRMLTGTLPFQAESAQETMIKRLTDDPLPLNQAVPGANFPARLQAVMDRALARMPAERYGSAAEFARDAVRATEGMAAGPAADREGATQLIDAARTAQMAQTRVSGHREGGPTAVRTPETPLPRPAPAAGKKKAPVGLIAAVVGVVVVGGGTAAVVMSRGGARPPAGGTELAQTPSVTGDTASAGAQGNPSGQTRTQPGTRQPPATPQPANGSGERTTPPVARPAPVTTAQPAVDSAAIDTQLFGLLEDSDDPAEWNTVRQRSVDIYSDAAIPKSLRAEAAALVSIVYQSEGDRDRACRWIANALLQRPEWDSYRKTQQRLACQ